MTICISNNIGSMYFRYNGLQSVFSSIAHALINTKHHNYQTFTNQVHNGWITRDLQLDLEHQGDLFLHILSNKEIADEVV